MNTFIVWHKKKISWWKKKLNISNYSIAWIAFIKGLIIGLLIYHFFINTETKAQTLKVIDGDTIILNGEKIRFSGIDAPEMKQMCSKDGQKIFCGMLAKMILIKRIGNETSNCIKEGKDRYDRTLAECFVNGESLSSFLVRSGYAFAYRKYSEKFIKDEEHAKQNMLGIWSMEFKYPWNFRKSL